MKQKIYASDIKGFCTVQMCWDFLHDISEQMEREDMQDGCFPVVSLPRVEVSDSSFMVPGDCGGRRTGESQWVWTLAAAAFELMLGYAVFNGMGESVINENTPLPCLPDKEAGDLNVLLHRCLQYDASKRPKLSEISKIAAEQSEKFCSAPRQARVSAAGPVEMPECEIDRKWPDGMSSLCRCVVAVFMMLSTAVSVSAQISLEEMDKNTMVLVESALALRNTDEASWERVRHNLGEISEVFTLMDELQDVENDCSLLGGKVRSFGLNRMIRSIKESRIVVQNTGKGLLDGSDARFNYSVYEKGVCAGCTAVYDRLSGRSGRQVFVIVPYSPQQQYETELSIAGRDVCFPARKDSDGVTYYVVDTEAAPSADDVLILKIKNADAGSNHSFIIINHNYRNR